MSLILAEVNAGANERDDVIIRTLELSSAAWPTVQRISTGFTDRTLVDETGASNVYQGLNIDIALAAKNNKGNQTLAFAVDNTTGEVTRLARAAIEAQERVSGVYRTYLSGNLSGPAEKPYRLTLLAGSIKGVIAQLQMGYFNVIGVAWPRSLYDVNRYPGLRYI